MQVILLEKVANLGELGAVVKVKDGFARNFLFARYLGITDAADACPVEAISVTDEQGRTDVAGGRPELEPAVHVVLPVDGKGQ